jgi:hypothetical protein
MHRLGVPQRSAPARNRLGATKQKALMTMLMAMLLVTLPVTPPVTLRI